MTDDDHTLLRGNLHAIEHLLGQIFVMLLENSEDPQAWIEKNASDTHAKIMQPNSLNQQEKDAAYGTVRRVMEITSTHFQAAGRGQKVRLES